MTERLDRIEQGIEDLNSTVNALVSEFIRPMAQQSVENQRLIAANAEAIAITNAGISELRQSIELLTQSTDDSADEAMADSRRITENENRFNILLAEAQQDRQNADADRAENARRFDEMVARSDQRFDAQLAEIRAQGEQIRALLSALATTNGRVDNLEQAS